jgi:hypothetical protein
MNKLAIIKILHTVIWVFFNVVLFYLFYSVINNVITKWLWICIGIIVMEGLILLIFKGMCPLTLVAQKYSDSTKYNFDIYLPNWLARYNKLIYSLFFGLIIILLIYRLVTN